MSLIPLLLDVDPWESRRRHIPNWDHFGLGITPDDIHALIPQLNISSQRPKRIVGKDGFQVCLDVKQFKPNEITVKTVDNTVIVEGKHEEREDDHGHISRHFVRKYTLPENYDARRVVSTLSSDGVLTVKAPPPQKDEAKQERVVEIQHTGPAHLTVKHNPQEEAPKAAA